MQDTLHTASPDHATPAQATDSTFDVTDQIRQSDSIIFFPAASDSAASTASADQNHTINIWKTHELKQIHSSPQQIKDSTPGWLFVVLIAVIGVLTYLRVFYRKNFFQIISACFNNNLTNQIVRDENLLMQRASVMLNITFSITAAAFIYLVSIYYDWSLNGMGTGFIRFIFLALIVSAAFTLKFVVLRLCAFLFNLSREMSTYIFNVFIINNLLGMTLFPFVVLILFGNILSTGLLITIALCLIGAAYIYRIGRGMLIAIGYPGFSPVYIFLYLCALEIAPLLVLLKVVAKQ